MSWHRVKDHGQPPRDGREVRWRYDDPVHGDLWTVVDLPADDDIAPPPVDEDLDALADKLRRARKVSETSTPWEQLHGGTQDVWRNVARVARAELAPRLRPMSELPDGHGPVLMAYDGDDFAVIDGTYRDDDGYEGRIGWLPLPASTGEAQG